MIDLAKSTGAGASTGLAQLGLPDRAPGALDALLATLIERMGARWAVKDAATGRYLGVSADMAEFFGRAPQDVIGRSDTELLDAPLATAFRAAEQTALAQGQPLTSEHRFEWKGARHEFNVLRLGVAGEGGARWLCSIWLDQAAQRQRDAQLRTALEQLEQQQRANEQLRREIKDQALRDPMTGLYGRTHFDDQLRREVDLSTREHREFALVFIEIDPVSAAVHELGEAAYDRVLEALGRLLRSNTRAMDASCRLGDNRFAILLSGVGLATAHSRMEGLRRQCATQIVMHEGRELGLTVSMGVASFPHTSSTQESLVGSCETALQEAQRRGGNHVTLASIRFEAS
ncbi:MAG TPA: diguanylate cyclase [Burkholderiaceae bacterium]|jgi:diguanylate cyclase (GGDEF)-like protein|nr:diguanylate cyclase [Burkholderiaceae bacterium]